MLPVLILLLLLLGFWAFIVWDRKRLRETKGVPLSRETMKKGFTPSGVLAWQVSFGLGAMFALLAFAEWQTPSLPPFSGRWSWVNALAYKSLGGQGLLTLYLAIAVATIGFGLALLVTRNR